MMPDYGGGDDTAKDIKSTAVGVIYNKCERAMAAPPEGGMICKLSLPSRNAALRGEGEATPHREILLAVAVLEE